VSEELERAENKARGPIYVIAGGTPEGAVWQVVARPDGEAVKAFAVLVPPDAPRPVKWQDYVRKIDEVERASGYDFFPALPGGAQARLESARNDPADVLQN
jgi:DNA/RNA endonuclease G (NUC1)